MSRLMAAFMILGIITAQVTTLLYQLRDCFTVKEEKEKEGPLQRSNFLAIPNLIVLLHTDYEIRTNRNLLATTFVILYYHELIS